MILKILEIGGLIEAYGESEWSGPELPTNVDSKSLVNLREGDKSKIFPNHNPGTKTNPCLPGGRVSSGVFRVPKTPATSAPKSR